MKGFGNLLTAIGIVAMLAVIGEYAIGWKLLPNDRIEILFFVGSLIFILFGVIFRSIGKSKEKKAMQNNQQMFVQQPYMQQNMNYQQSQQPYAQQNVNYQQSQNPNYPNN